MKASTSNLRERAEARRKQILEVQGRFPEIAVLDGRILSLLKEAARESLRPSGKLESLRSQLDALYTERAGLIKRCRVEEAYWEIPPACTRCGDEGYLFEAGRYRPCSCREIQFLSRKFRSAQLSDRMRKQGFDNFDLSYYSSTSKIPRSGGKRTPSERANMEKILSASRLFVDDVLAGGCVESLFFTGGCGVGKTHLVSAIANSLVLGGVVPLYAVVADLLADLKSTYGEGESPFTESHLLSRAREVSVLLLDDLGAERYSGWVGEKLFQIINYRYLHEKPTVITSNYDLEQLEEVVGERIVSRIVEMCRPFYFFGPDVRLLKRQARVP
ncbi:MAG: ATP-binding protein [Firmicutes bacterium]|nr:ATP-binding protein [Bacillota bacterium]